MHFTRDTDLCNVFIFRTQSLTCTKLVYFHPCCGPTEFQCFPTSAIWSSTMYPLSSLCYISLKCYILIPAKGMYSHPWLWWTAAMYTHSTNPWYGALICLYMFTLARELYNVITFPSMPRTSKIVVHSQSCHIYLYHCQAFPQLTRISTIYGNLCTFRPKPLTSKICVHTLIDAHPN